MRTVSRSARLLDLAALAGILLGALLCLWSNARMTEISKLSYRHPGPPSVSALAAADRARYVAYGGVLLILAGCGVGVASAIRHSRQKAAAA
jgi:ABC-type lipoprotein release transport system permease subunit